MAIRRVLIAVDESPIAVNAAKVGVELAQSLAAELGFVHAIERCEGYTPGCPSAELLATASDDAKKLIEQLASNMGNIRAVVSFVPVGKPAEEIVKTAGAWPADVIVLGSHGRSGLKRVLLGSVAEGVLRHAMCPVLVVRAPD
ncbi:Universal stress protein family [Labilithrix luteola]|uniref:Universal stress protein n=1 Tax=Labilithrix luteola TaxID=1391654 RepID=A0A0K1Q6I2_9BACT|nr:universal stress protein [Labilithrix luteola]AKV01025.1 Universal stress protein family [Labilithrix luteola]